MSAKKFLLTTLSVCFTGLAVCCATAADIDIFVNKDLQGVRQRVQRRNDAAYVMLHANEIVIDQTGGMFVTPHIPLDSSGNALGEHVYMAYFKPNYENLWTGNLKRFTLGRNGLDGLADADGNIRGNAYFDWDSGSKTDEIDDGGAAALMANAISARRKFYTYTGSSGNRLASPENAFSVENPQLTTLMMQTVTEDERRRTIETVRAAGFGAVIHSRPATAFYPAENLRIIFVGTNSGALHCINDRQGTEIWSFIMPEHLPRLKNALYSNPLYNSYFADNTPVVRDIAGRKILIYGSRRGGSSYVALDVTDYNDPLFLYSIDYNWLEGPLLGLSWGVPVFAKTHSDATPARDNDLSEAVIHSDEIKSYEGVHDVVILPGGYDSATSLPADNGKPSNRGQAVIGFDPLTGTKDPAFDLLNIGQSPIMRHAVLDVSVTSLNGQGVVDRLYFGDTGGNVFCAIPFAPAAYLDPGSAAPRYAFKAAAQFHPYKIFATAGAGPATQKIMFAPDVVVEKGVEYIYFGTGDRENPTDTSVTDKFYCLKLKDRSMFSPTPDDEFFLTEDDLTDVTANWLYTGNERQRTQAEDELANKNGWMLTLAAGEKVVSRPLVFNGIVFFTTYALTKPADETSPPRGEGRFYALNYKTGAPAYDFLKQKADVDPAKAERYKSLGDAMPTAPALYIFNDKVVVLVAAGKRLFQVKLDLATTLNVFYWREVY